MVGCKFIMSCESGPSASNADGDTNTREALLLVGCVSLFFFFLVCSLNLLFALSESWSPALCCVSGVRATEPDGALVRGALLVCVLAFQCNTSRLKQSSQSVNHLCGHFRHFWCGFAF